MKQLALWGFAAVLLAATGASAQQPVTGFCVANGDEIDYLFTVDNGAGERKFERLEPGQSLCTSETTGPQSGFVSVFFDMDSLEGCSRLATAGGTETLVRYVDFDRCEWSGHGG